MEVVKIPLGPFNYFWHTDIKINCPYVYVSQLIAFSIAAALGAAWTYALQRLGIPTVAASCVVGLVGVVISHYLNIPHLSAVIFTGSFVGMTDLDLLRLPHVTLGGAIAGVIYSFTLNIFSGYGGRLGAIAFISVMAVIVIFNYLLKESNFLKKGQ